MLAKRKQDKFQAFYTDCHYITDYMIELLQYHKEMSVLEPCAGEGAFIDELIKIDKAINITAYELNSHSVNILKNKYLTHKNIKIEQEDFLLLFRMNNNKFDRIIANPPYGAYQSPEKRKQLKSNYPKIYTKETYGLFLIKAMELLKDNGRLVFIVPDTYLTLHMHEGLRNKILNNYQIESITLFPSKFFPNVNFGYAGLSIISLLNKLPNDNYHFSVYNQLKSPVDLLKLLNSKSDNYKTHQLSYSQLKNNPSSAFFLTYKNWISSILYSKENKIGNICAVVTGFYSGNDAHYLRRSESVTRGIKKYVLIDNKLICKDNLSIFPPLNGIDRAAHWIPIVKGGNKRFYKKSEWFMNWSKEAIHDYKVINKKRARFQNSQYYFKQGIGVPMVSSASITASLIDGRLFDQSIVGVFPHKEYQYLTYYLLGFFNSTVCNSLIRTINSSANNSSSYIKKIPILIPNNSILNEIDNEVKKLISLSKHNHITNDNLERLNYIFNKIYKV